MAQKKSAGTGGAASADGPDLPEALHRLGARRVEATLVAALLDSDSLETRELVERTGLRQPEVSVGMRELRERGWISSEPMPRAGKGRPMHRHRLTASRGEILHHYELQGEETLQRFEAALGTLRQRLQ